MNKTQILSVIFIFTLAGVAMPAFHAQNATSSNLFFNYKEQAIITNGRGNYSGYYSNAWINGTESLAQIHSRGNVSMNYNYSCSIKSSGFNYINKDMAKGNFSFSTISCKYTNGTDNETGYTNPYVWFYTNNTISPNTEKELLNTRMKVISTDYSYLPKGSSKYITTIYLRGNGTYIRKDSYGTFNATYNWNAYYDKASGFIVAYTYSEVDSNGKGDGFACTNTLYVSNSSYGVHISPLQPGVQKPSAFPYSLIAIISLLAFAIIIVIAVAYVNANKHKIKKHSNGGGPVKMSENSEGRNETDIHLDPESKGTEQVVIKEIVKVKCQYCGALIDSTAEKCPFCGAPRN